MVSNKMELSASEQALIGRIRNGAREDFQVLVRRYQDRIYSLALRLMADSGEAEEIAQEAFLRAYQNLDRFQEQSSFYTWLHRITMNLALSRLKYLERRGRGKTLSLESDPKEEAAPLPEPVDQSPDPRQRLMEQDLENQLQTALQRLPQELRVIVVLRDVENRSYEEIAKAAGLPLGTVKSRLHQGRALLQKMMAGFLSA